MKCFALESTFNLSYQAEHTKINRRLNFNPGLAHGKQDNLNSRVGKIKLLTDMKLTKSSWMTTHFSHDIDRPERGL